MGWDKSKGFRVVVLGFCCWALSLSLALARSLCSLSLSLPPSPSLSLPFPCARQEYRAPSFAAQILLDQFAKKLQAPVPETSAQKSKSSAQVNPYGKEGTSLCSCGITIGHYAGRNRALVRAQVRAPLRALFGQFPRDILGLAARAARPAS